MNAKLLIGRRLVNMVSSFDVSSPGCTSAIFQMSGNWPDCKDKLIILVRTGRRTSRHSTTRSVGIGSKEEDFLLDLAIRFLMSSSHSSRNESSWKAGTGGGARSSRVDSAISTRAVSSSVRMRSIFWVKKEPMCWPEHCYHCNLGV